MKLTTIINVIYFILFLWQSQRKYSDTEFTEVKFELIISLSRKALRCYVYWQNPGQSTANKCSDYSNASHSSVSVSRASEWKLASFRLCAREFSLRCSSLCLCFRLQELESEEERSQEAHRQTAGEWSESACTCLCNVIQVFDSHFWKHERNAV